MSPINIAVAKKSKKKTTNQTSVSSLPNLINGRYIALGLFMLVIALYVNTVTHDFALDDAIVITDNEFTKQGISGLGDIFGKDTFHGFFGEAGKDKLVSGGRYRPFSLAMFAIERSIFGESPLMHHIINIIAYGFTGILVYFLGFKLFDRRFDSKKAQFMALSFAILYIVHPLHTEAVANIKGRDEIMAMLGSISALYIYARKSFEDLNFRDHLLAAILLFIGLLSKENAITFVLVIPLAAYLLFDKSLAEAIKVAIPMLGAAILFMIIRTSVIGFDFGSEPSQELMNNPYLKIVNNKYVAFSGGEKLATIFFTLWKYIQLLICPFPLTHDYYPNHISLKTFGNPLAILGLISYLCLIVVAIWGVLKRKWWSFFISYFLITISIVSNLVFPIGTHMSERFMYMPSLAFVALVSILLFARSGKSTVNVRFGILAAITIGFGIITITRNAVWENNYTLFTTDALTSSQSAKVNNAAAGAIGEKLKVIADGPEKLELIARSHQHLDNAISAHPNYINAYLIKGNAYFYENRFEEAIQQYNQCLRIDPSYDEAQKNLFIAYRAAGRYYGEQKNDLNNALKYLQLALNSQPQDFEANRLIATCYGIMGNHPLAVKHFKKCTEIEPNNASAYVNLSKAYEFAGNLPASSDAKQKALSLDQNIFNK